MPWSATKYVGHTSRLYRCSPSRCCGRRSFSFSPAALAAIIGVVGYVLRLHVYYACQMYLLCSTAIYTVWFLPLPGYVHAYVCDTILDIYGTCRLPSSAPAWGYMRLPRPMNWALIFLHVYLMGHAFRFCIARYSWDRGRDCPAVISRRTAPIPAFSVPHCIRHRWACSPCGHPLHMS